MTQHLDRRGKIGGSDLPAILGHDPYTTPYAAWLNITGRRVREDNDHMLRGRLCEPSILSLIEHYTSSTRRPSIGQVTHPQHDFLIATPDAVLRDDLTDQLAVAEAKCPAHYDGGPLPESYVIQVTHYQGMLRAGENWQDRAYVGVLSGAFSLHSVPWDRDRYEAQVGFAVDWHAKHIATDTPPPLTTTEDVALAHPVSRKGKTRVACERAHQILGLLRQIDSTAKECDGSSKKLRDELRVLLEDAEILVDEEGRELATFKTHWSDRFDLNRLKLEMPEVWRTFTERKPTRPLLLKQKEGV